MIVETLPRRPLTTTTGRSRFGTWVTATRPRQWAKNALVAVPAVAAASIGPAVIARLVVAFVVLTAVAGGTYLINDVLDVDADRLHPIKRHRPVAAGRITPSAARRAGIGLLVAGPLLAAVTLSAAVAVAVAVYGALTVTYSVWLKRVPYVDVAVLAAGFAVRIEVGALAVGHATAAALVLAVFATAVLIATGKRRAELLAFGDDAPAVRRALAGYRLGVTNVVADVAGIVAAAAAVWWLAQTSLYVEEREALVVVGAIVALGTWRLLRLAHGGDLAVPERLVSDRVLLAAACAGIVSLAGTVLTAPLF